MDNIDFSNMSSGAIDPERQSPQSEFDVSVDTDGTANSETITKEDIQVFLENSKIVTDTIDSFCSVMLRPDGSRADFSDKEGRKTLSDSIVANTKMLSEGKTAIEKAGTSILDKIPMEVDAKFDKEDRERFDKFFHWYKGGVITLVIISFFIGAIFVIGIYLCVTGGECKEKFETKSKELERKIADYDQKTLGQQEAIDFGEYMKKVNPKTLSNWRRKNK